MVILMIIEIIRNTLAILMILRTGVTIIITVLTVVVRMERGPKPQKALMIPRAPARSSIIPIRLKVSGLGAYDLGTLCDVDP